MENSDHPSSTTKKVQHFFLQTFLAQSHRKSPSQTQKYCQPQLRMLAATWLPTIVTNADVRIIVLGAIGSTATGTNGPNGMAPR